MLQVALSCLLLIGVLDLDFYLGTPILDERVFSLALGLALAQSFSGYWRVLPIILGAVTFLYYDSFIDPYSRVTWAYNMMVLWIPLVLFGIWRLAGKTFAIVVGLFLLYGYFGNLVPKPFKAYPLEPFDLSIFLAADNTAMLGISMNIVCTVVFCFLLLGSALKCSNVIYLINNYIKRVFKDPAKISVCSSMLFGSVSGSAVSNVVSTGQITIPLMISAGYSRVRACAIEAVASTGGQIMPPVMGAAAFLMASILGMSYADIAIAGIIPALIVYGYILLAVHLTRSDTRTVPADNKHLTWPNIREMLGETGANTSSIMLLAAGVGLVIGVLDQTGLAFNLATILANIGQNSQFLLLVLTAVICIVLGMGMPTTTAYLIVAILVAPALIKVGINPLSAHFFVLYFSVISMLSPPVALSCLAAANIGKADPLRVSLYSLLYAAPIIILPFLFVYIPALLLVF